MHLQGIHHHKGAQINLMNEIPVVDVQKDKNFTRFNGDTGLSRDEHGYRVFLDVPCTFNNTLVSQCGSLASTTFKEF